MSASQSGAVIQKVAWLSVEESNTQAVTVPVWDTVTPAAAISVKLSVQHVSASLQVIGRDLFHGAALGTPRHIYRSPARDTDCGGVREGGLESAVSRRTFQAANSSST